MKVLELAERFVVALERIATGIEQGNQQQLNWNPVDLYGPRGTEIRLGDPPRPIAVDTRPFRSFEPTTTICGGQS